MTTVDMWPDGRIRADFTAPPQPPPESADDEEERPRFTRAVDLDEGERGELIDLRRKVDQLEELA